MQNVLVCWVVLNSLSQWDGRAVIIEAPAVAPAPFLLADAVAASKPQFPEKKEKPQNPQKKNNTLVAGSVRVGTCWAA